jgi:hypothetical protein
LLGEDGVVEAIEAEHGVGDLRVVEVWVSLMGKIDQTLPGVCIQSVGDVDVISGLCSCGQCGDLGAKKVFYVKNGSDFHHHG